MNCQEFQEYISAAVDQCLPKNDVDRFLDHLRRCPPCRAEYEMDATTKMVVRSRCRRVRTPASVAAIVLDRVAREEGRPRMLSPIWWRAQWERPSAKPVLFFAAAFLVMLILVRPDRQTPGSDIPDVITQSVANYHAFQSGVLSPELLSDQPGDLTAFFAQRTAFPVTVRRLTDAVLVGGIVNDCSGEPLAHLVYRSGENLIYVCQASWEGLQRGDRLKVPERAVRLLKDEGWFSEDMPEGGSVLVWKRGGTLCTAVSPMPQHAMKQTLLLTTTTGDPW